MTAEDKYNAPTPPAGALSDEQRRKLKRAATRDIILYGLARLGLFLVLTFIIHSIVILVGLGNAFPLLISMTLALILALPLSMFLFKNLRLRVTRQIGEWDADRQRHKNALREQLQERLED